MVRQPILLTSDFTLKLSQHLIESNTSFSSLAQFQATHPTMASRTPLFWKEPIRYLRWSSRERPALFWSCAIGGAGPVMLAVVPPLRHRLGDPDAAPIPQTYPVPTGPRKQLTGYGDETEN